MIHEDERRILEDWPEAKIITAKKDCRLGDHYHKVKTEKFILIEGDVNIYRGNDGEKMILGKLYVVLPNTIHSFTMKKGAKMIGLCSHIYDPTDDYK